VFSKIRKRGSYRKKLSPPIIAVLKTFMPKAAIPPSVKEKRLHQQHDGMLRIAV
jgi:hypothetical protein